MMRLGAGFAAILAGGLLIASAMAAEPQVLMAAEQQAPMKSTAPEKMMPSGAGEKMRECDKMAMDQHIKMEDRAQFVKDCVDKKMK
jgi:hypothetical protein